MNLTVEVCVENAGNALAAERGGADRVELCASLLEGGLTPSFGMAREALRRLAIPAMVMVRPRGGDFLYSGIEFAAMLADVKALRDMGAAGVVFGCLSPDGRVDRERMSRLVDAAGDMQTVCHRAIDMTRDSLEALEVLAACGVTRVLTSGRRNSALEGQAILRQTIAAAAGRIAVLVCGGVRRHNIAEVLAATGASEVHFSAGVDAPSGMVYRNPDIGMGAAERDREYLNRVTSEELVRETIAAARGWTG